MGTKEDLKELAILGVGLLIVMVIFGFIFIFASQLEKTTCQDIEENVYNSGRCYNDTSVANRILVESDSFNSTKDVVTAIKLAVTFLIIIVLAILIKIVLRIIDIKKLGL